MALSLKYTYVQVHNYMYIIVQINARISHLCGIFWDCYHCKNIDATSFTNHVQLLQYWFDIMSELDNDDDDYIDGQLTASSVSHVGIEKIVTSTE